MTERKVQVLVEESLNGAGHSFIQAKILLNGEQKGVAIPFRRNATPSEISSDLYRIGVVYNSKVEYPRHGEIYIEASRMVPGL